jgi:hypothetical protein
MCFVGGTSSYRTGTLSKDEQKLLDDIRQQQPEHQKLQVNDLVLLFNQQKEK